MIHKQPYTTSNNSKNKRKERRKKLLQEYQKENLIYLWRIFVYSSTSGVLGYLLILNGWIPITKQHIKVSGNRNISNMNIVIAAGLTQPKPLLKINPKELKRKLINDLPVSSVVIQRHLIPSGLEIQIMEKEVIAYANRIKNLKQEMGVVDQNANWIPMKIASKGSLPKTSITIEGWRLQHRARIAEVLKHRKKLGSSLKKITLTPDGEMNLQTEDLPLILLGQNQGEINKKIQILIHLVKALPSKLEGKELKTLDISDPSKPELQL